MSIQRAYATLCAWLKQIRKLHRFVPCTYVSPVVHGASGGQSRPLNAVTAAGCNDADLEQRPMPSSPLSAAIHASSRGAAATTEAGGDASTASPSAPTGRLLAPLDPKPSRPHAQLDARTATASQGAAGTIGDRLAAGTIRERLGAAPTGDVSMTRLTGAGLAVRQRDESPSGWREGLGSRRGTSAGRTATFRFAFAYECSGKLSLFGMGGARFATSFESTKSLSWTSEGGYTASRATIFLGNVVRAPHARARTSHRSMGGYEPATPTTFVSVLFHHLSHRPERFCSKWDP